MGESTCLIMQPFSYVSGLSHFDPAEGNKNSIQSLTQSISFGRFVSDSGSWEKWSVFSSHNRYVEEAERFSRPGSVAQKKAFFEAHYKEMAARKAAAEAEAAAAAAEAEQMNASSNEPKNSNLTGGEGENGSFSQALNFHFEENPIGRTEVGESETEQSGALEIEKPPLKDLLQQQDTVNQEVPVCSEDKKSKIVSSMLPGQSKAAVKKQPLTPAKPLTPAVYSRKEVYATTPRSNKKPGVDFADKRKPTTPKQVLSSSTTPRGSINKVTAAQTLIHKVVSSRSVIGTSSVSRNCETPTSVKVPPNGISRSVMATPGSSRTPKARSAVEIKSAGPNAQSLSTDYLKTPSAYKSKLQSPSLSSPFKLRTVERAARRKEKLEEKFNSDDPHKTRQQSSMKDNADDLELKKFRETLCFKARPMPKFYKEKSNNNPTAKAPKAWPKSGENPRLTTSVRRKEDSLPSQTQRPIWNSDSRQIQGKTNPLRNPTPIRSRASVPSKTITAENVSPNVQRMEL